MPFDRRALLVRLSAVAFVTTALPALAASANSGADGNAPQPYTEAAFDAAQAAGKPILIDTYATWCQICARQAPILESLRVEPRFKDLVTLKVDFDTQKDVMRKFRASVQSTLIVFKGKKEVGRSTGETQPEWIDDLLGKAVTDHTS